jgi:hypothetical protein
VGTVLLLQGVGVAGNNVLQAQDGDGNDVVAFSDDGSALLEMREAGSGFFVRDVVNGNIFALDLDTATQVLATAYALATSRNAAPADASLAAGQAALWYDSTNGASKLMVKAKQADGTVKTAAIALA